MVGWRSQHLPVYLHPKLPPVLPVQSVNELGHEPRRMVQRQQFVKRRRQHPHLFSAHRSKRHISISPTGVPSKVHPTTYPLPAQTSETGSIANFSLGSPNISSRAKTLDKPHDLMFGRERPSHYRPTCEHSNKSRSASSGSIANFSLGSPNISSRAKTLDKPHDLMFGRERPSHYRPTCEHSNKSRSASSHHPSQEHRGCDNHRRVSASEFDSWAWACGIAVEDAASRKDGD